MSKELEEIVNDAKQRIIDIAKKHPMIAVKKDGLLLRHIPEEIQNLDICIAAVQQNRCALGFVSIDFISDVIKFINKVGNET